MYDYPLQKPHLFYNRFDKNRQGGFNNNNNNNNRFDKNRQGGNQRFGGNRPLDERGIEKNIKNIMATDDNFDIIIKLSNVNNHFLKIRIFF